MTGRVVGSAPNFGELLGRARGNVQAVKSVPPQAHSKLGPPSMYDRYMEKLASSNTTQVARVAPPPTSKAQGNKTGPPSMYEKFIERMKSEVQANKVAKHCHKEQEDEGGAAIRKRSDGGVTTKANNLQHHGQPLAFLAAEGPLEQQENKSGLADVAWVNAVMERMPSEGGRMSINTSMARSSKCILQICARNLNWIEREVGGA